MAAERLPKIVRLDAVYAILNPTFSFPHQYVDYPLSKPEEVPERIAGADVVITTRVALSASDIEGWAKSNEGEKLISVHAIGTDMIDLAACKAFGITVSNVPAASNESVAEHAIALYFSLRRKLQRMHRCLVQSDFWLQKGTTASVFGPLPTTARGEKVGIVGGGELGNRVAKICEALGMQVSFSEHKGVAVARPGRAAFEDILRLSSVVFITCPLTPATLNMITIKELEMMRKDALLVNVARGGIVNEEDLVTALRSHLIDGAATDVFIKEPTTAEDNVLVRAARDDLKLDVTAKDGEGSLNLVLIPHLAWYARSSIERLQDVTVENVDEWIKGQPINIVK